MDSNLEDNNPKKDWLSRLVRRANAVHSQEIGRPSGEAIRAYFSGEATNEQRGDVIAALARSLEFRKELKEIAEDLAAVMDEDVLSNLSLTASENTEVPDLSGYWPASKNQPIGKPKRITSLFNFRILVPLVAAAAALVLWFSPLIQHSPGYQLVSEAVDPGKLISLKVRSTDDQPEVKAFESAEEAAYAAFREMLILEDYTLSVNPEYASQLSKAQFDIHLSNRLLSITIGEGVKGVLGCDGCDEVQGWLLALSSRRLWSFDPTLGSLEVDWLPEYGDIICLAFSYTEGTAYSFGHGVVINLED